MKTAEETRDIYYLCGYYQNILSLITEDCCVSVDYKSEEEQIIVTFHERERDVIVSQYIVNVHLSSVRASVSDFIKQFLLPFLQGELEL